MSYTQPIPLLDLKAQYAPIREEIRAAFDRVADAQAFIGGPEVEGLEKEVAAYSQCQFGIGVTSGTDALLGRADGPRHPAGRRGDHHAVHLLRHRRLHPPARRSTRCSWTSTRTPTTSTRP